MGLWGSGKSTVGKRLAREIQATFIDLDDYIVKTEGKSIPEIFAENGEEYFRQLETTAIQQLSGKNIVVACGGGTMLRSENADFARKFGAIVYIDAKFETCYNRIKDDKNRPIAASRTKDQLYELFCQRKSIYESNSDYIVSANGRPDDIAVRIIKTLD